MDYGIKLAIDSAGRDLEEIRERDRQRDELVTRRGDRRLIYKTREVSPRNFNARTAPIEKSDPQYLDPQSQQAWDAWLQSHLARQGFSKSQQEVINDILGAMQDMIGAIGRLQYQNSELRDAIKALPGREVLISGPTPALDAKLERLEKSLCAEISGTRSRGGTRNLIRKRRDDALT
jgi:hypothetical protein